MATCLNGSISLPGDKSLSHRAAMFSVLASGVSNISNISNGGDVASTISCLTLLGADYDHDGTTLVTRGKGLRSLGGNDIDLDCGNSGTSLRLLTGLLCGQDVHNVSLVGDESLSRRPHNRVIDPLQAVGVDISGRDGSFTPVVINQSVPQGAAVRMTVASAQVKSAVLLAGLYAKEPMVVMEVKKTRDHTENMLSSMGVEVNSVEMGNENHVVINPPTAELSPLNCAIPGDPSSAAFFGVAAAIIPGSTVTITGMLLNPTRIAWIEVLERMGADISIDVTDTVVGEPVGDVTISHKKLNAVDVEGDIISSLIDELPILAVAMAYAHGTSTVRDAHELRVKESDRITTVVNHLASAGIKATEHEDGYDIVGGAPRSCSINAHGDHRIVMAFSVLNYAATGEWKESNRDVVGTSFPAFYDLFTQLITP